MEEIGPFIYKETVFKDNLVDNLNFTLTYNDRRNYEFIPEMSVHNESFEITTLNMAVVAVIEKLKYANMATILGVDAVLAAYSEKILVTKTIREILWGYEDSLLNLLVPFGFAPTNIIGFFIQHNDTETGKFTVHTGEDDYTKVGWVDNYNDKP